MIKDQGPGAGPAGGPGGLDEPELTSPAKQIRDSLLQPAPRKLPWLLTLSLILSSGWLAGLALLSFGFLFAWAFVQPTGICKEARLRFGHPATTSGQVLESFDTHLSVGEAGSGGVVYVYGCDYTFTVAEGKFRGRSYTNGQVFWPGERVTVEYLPGKPEISGIRGARAASKGWVLAVFPLLFPLAGLIQVANQTRKGLVRARLIRTGEPDLAVEPLARLGPSGQWQVRSPLKAVLKIMAALALLAPLAICGAWWWWMR